MHIFNSPQMINISCLLSAGEVQNDLFESVTTELKQKQVRK